jgi:glutathione S-transferase
VITIWGRISSINVRKVVLTAQLLDIPFRRIDAGGSFGVTRTPEYLAHNPNALVPLLEDGGFRLWESNVIVRYLGACYGQGGFYPQDLQARFDAERWMEWQQTTLNPAGRDAFWQTFRVPPGQRRQDLIDGSIAATEPLWDLLEAHLQGRAFVAGPQLTVADVPLACEMHRWRGTAPWRPRPRVDAWYAGLLQRPAARGVLDLPLS